MQDRVESTGRTVEAALQSALTVLGARREDVHWDVLDPGSARLLGLFGSRPARVRVERLPAPPADERQTVVDLLATLGIQGQVDVRRDGDLLEVVIATEDADGLLIGRRGETLAALQHILGRLISKQFQFAGTVSVDVGGYRHRREAQLADKARVLAGKVQATGRAIHFEPLNAHDRRVVHGALEAVAGVRTYTAGQGLHRSVVIVPTSRPPAATIAP